MFKRLKSISSSFPWMADILVCLRVAFAVSAVVAVLSLFKQNSYESDARILPVEGKGAQGGVAGLAAAAAAFGINAPSTDGGDANFVDVLQSRWLKEQLLNKVYTFTERKWYFGRAKSYSETLESHMHARNMDVAVREFGDILTVSRDIKSRMIQVSAETHSPELSQQITNESLRLLEEFAIKRVQTRGGAKAVYAAARLAEARNEMSKSEGALRGFLDGNRNFQTSVDPSVRITAARLDAELKMSQQLVATLAINREQALMEEKNDIPILNILDYGNLPIEKKKPARAPLVLSWFLFTGLLTWTWLNRRKVIKFLSPPQDD